jgi:lipopolysaccharide transport system ATP-binding protein
VSDVAITVENLGKEYRIGTRKRHDTLRDTLAGTFKRSNVTTLQRDNSFWALRDVSFEVKRGEVVGVIGRNGAGKSTLLKILSRITEPTTGRAVIHGRVGSLLEVGTGFHPELTGRENIYLNGAILGMRRTEIDRRFDEIVAFSEIERFLDTPVKRYSSGMYVRLAFAVAAHLEPEVLIVDEVLAVGDASFQKKCLGKMGDVAGEGRTVIFVSHNMAAVVTLCPRAMLLSDGAVAYIGETAQAVSEYLGGAVSLHGGVVSLEEHPARLKRYRPVIRELRIGTDRCMPTDTLFPDESLVVDLLIDPTDTIQSPRLAVAIEDSLGRRIMTVASYFGGQPLPDVLGRRRVTCKVPSVDLGEGRYLISVSIGTKSEGLLDSVDGAAWFEVMWRNSSLGGEPYGSYYGPVLKPSAWTMAAETV